ncbi:ABC transporter permease [Bifidobacterium adolescentis]|nr:ABC transporter permease [Bifidobacterium adolescentis]
MTEMNETNPSTVLPGQERYVAPLDETPLKAVDSMDESAPASNMWADAVLSRLTDIFLALPILLGAIVVLQMFKTSSSIWKIILVMTLFGWTSVARIARGAVMEAKNLEFNTASTALGSTPIRNLFRHILPNSLAPIIVVGTTSLATYIVLEATLSFLGVGLPTTTVSWGGDISNAQSILRTDPMVLFYPSAALAIAVLAFIMMGDAVKDALDPKSRTA